MSTDGVQLRVVGQPIPQGSMIARFQKNRNGLVYRDGMPVVNVVASNNQKLAPWRRNVASVAKKAATMRASEGKPVLDGPLHLSVAFRFPMPKSRPKRDWLRSWTWRTVMPDLDKLVRAVGDGLTDSGLITDDARFVSIVATKVETIDAHKVGCVIQVFTLDGDGEPARVKPLDPRR